MARRRLLSMPDVTPSPEDTLVPSNLNLFVRDYQVIFPANQSIADDIAMVEDNGCSVLIREDACTSNLRVWLNVDQTDFQKYSDYSRAGNNVKAFNCYVLQPILTPPPIPLTPNVFLAPNDDWAYIPSMTGVHFNPTPRNSSLCASCRTCGRHGSPTPLVFSQAVYGFEIPVPGNAPMAGTYLYCDISINIDEDNDYYYGVVAVPLFADTARVCMGNASSDYDATTGTLSVTSQPLFNTTSMAHRPYIQHMQLLAAPECPG